MLNVIYGRNRRHLARRLRALAAAHQETSPFSRGFLLVPEQQKAGFERRYFTEDPNRSLMLEEVLSFRRFAARLAEIGGGGASRRISRGLQTFLLGRLIEKHKDELEAFGKAMFKPSFLGLVSEAIGDFLRYEISAEDLRQAARDAAAEGQPRLSLRLKDMALVMDAYQEKFRALGALPGDLVLNELLERLRALKAALKAAGGDWDRLGFPWSNYRFLRGASVWVHGFGVSRGLTPQEYRTVALLEGLCREVVITAESDRLPESQADAEKGEAAFRAGRELLARLREDFPRAIFTELEEETPRPEYYIQRFERPLDEERWTAGEVKRLLQQEGVKPQDIGIALASPEASQDMQLALRELGLPYYTTDNMLSAMGAFCRFNLALIRLLRFGFERDYLLPLLRSPYLGLTLAEADLLDNFMLARGLEYDLIWDDRRYVKVWRGEIFSAAEEDETGAEGAPDEDDEVDEETGSEDDASRCLTLRDYALGDLKELYDATREAMPAGAFARKILGFFRAIGAEETLRQSQQTLLEQGFADEAEQETKSWNTALKLLGEFAATDETAPLSTEDFLYYYEEAADVSRTQRIPAAGNQIILGSLNQLAQETCDYLFILGAEQKNLPGKGFQTGLFHTPDRLKISEYLDRAFPDTTEQRIYANASHLYALMRLPAGRVYFSYAGSPDKFAPIVEKLGRKAGIPKFSHAKAFGLRDPLLADRARAFFFAKALSGQSFLFTDEQKAEIAAINRLSREDEDLKRAAGLSAVKRELTPEGKLHLPAELAREALGNGNTWSISRLERYAACPFSFFSRYMLKLEPRSVWVPQASGYGNLLHKVMELSQETWLKALKGKRDKDRKEALAMLEKTISPEYIEAMFLEALREDPDLSLFWEKGEAFGVRHKAMRAAARTQRAIFDELFGSPIPWVPALEEWAFGPEEKRVYAVDLPSGGSIAFRGRIDRVDLANPDEGLRCARMIDYKTGAKRVNYASLYYGLDLQLPIYLKAFEALNEGSLIAIDAAYAPLNGTLVSLKTPGVPNEEKLAKMEKKALLLSEIGLPHEELKALSALSLMRANTCSEAIRSGAFSAEPRSVTEHAPCDYCDYKGLCGLCKGEIKLEVQPKLAEVVISSGASSAARYLQKDNLKLLLQDILRESHKPDPEPEKENEGAS